MIMSVVGILSHDWCFSLHRVLTPPEGADKPKEEQASASGAAGGAAAKPSTSQPPKKKEVGEGTVKHSDGSKVHNRAAYVIKKKRFQMLNVDTHPSWPWSKWRKDVRDQRIGKPGSLEKHRKWSVHKRLHHRIVFKSGSIWNTGRNRVLGSWDLRKSTHS